MPQNMVVAKVSSVCFIELFMDDGLFFFFVTLLIAEVNNYSS